VTVSCSKRIAGARGAEHVAGPEQAGQGKAAIETARAAPGQDQLAERRPVAEAVAVDARAPGERQPYGPTAELRGHRAAAGVEDDLADGRRASAGGQLQAAPQREGAPLRR